MATAKKTIFAVDDSKSNLVVISDALSDRYRVFTLSSGERLFKMLEKLMPDLILLDVEMPDMDGREVLTNLKNDSRFQHIPVIFLSSLDSNEAEPQWFSMGAAAYMAKPFSKPLLLEAIEKHL